MRYQQLIITEPAANFRALARQGIQGRWKDAFLKGFLFMLMLLLPVMLIDNPTRMTDMINDAMDKLVEGAITYEEYMQTMMSAIYGGLYYLSSLYTLIIGGVLEFGIASLYMRYRRRQETPTELLFSGFSNFSRAIAVNVLMAIFTFLWTLLFIIPGIIAYYRYRLAFYILADNPDIGPLEAISISKAMMAGNKWKLFCLDISFIGWAIVVVIATVLISMPFMFISVGTTASPTITPDAFSLPTIAVSIVSYLTCGLLYVYHGTSVAAFYERASGLLKYRDEVAAINNLE